MLNYALMPKLEHIALVKIVTTLWNQDDITALIKRLDFPLPDSEIKKWQKIEDRVVEKVPQLPQPGPLKEKIIGFIKPIGLQILKWMEYHTDGHFPGIYLPNNLCWTPQGTIDEKKTAEALIKDETLDITTRYKLACVYCLEYDIPELWYKIPENRRKSFYNQDVNQQGLEVFWTYHVKGKIAKMENLIERWHMRRSPYQLPFGCAVQLGDKTATEYFFEKLTPSERNQLLVENAEDAAYSDRDSVLCFLLSKMNGEQQSKVFKSNSYEVLRCLLVWPWQSLFMETANRMWDFLSEEKYDLLLRRIVDKIIDGYKDYNYQRLFGEFWQQSPNAHKRYVIDECTRELLSKLFDIKDDKNIKLILEDANLIEKKKLVFSVRGKDICQQLVYGDRWDLLEFFIRDCISSKNEMMKLKEEFKERITYIACCSKEEFKSNKVKYAKFFQLLDDLIRGFDKKKECGRK